MVELIKDTASELRDNKYKCDGVSGNIDFVMENAGIKAPTSFSAKELNSKILGLLGEKRMKLGELLEEINCPKSSLQNQLYELKKNNVVKKNGDYYAAINSK